MEPIIIIDGPFRGWAYHLVTTLMDDSFLLNKKAERRRRRYQRRLKRIIRQAVKRYRKLGCRIESN